MSNKIVDWRELDLKSMDIILCAGTGKLSKHIQKFQRLVGASEDAAKISHAAGLRESNHLMLQESTTVNKWADNQKGVQENSFSKWLYHYPGEVYVKKLDFKRTLDFCDEDCWFWEEHRHDNYESGIPGALELFLCGLRLHRAVKKIFPNYVPQFTKEPHCTELQALRLLIHQLWRPEAEIVINRMPPYLWWYAIDVWLNVPVSEPIRIK